VVSFLCCFLPTSSLLLSTLPPGLPLTLLPVPWTLVPHLYLSTRERLLFVVYVVDARSSFQILLRVQR
jgi:hypothetical protein